MFHPAVNGDLVITQVAHLTNGSTFVYSDNESNSTVWPGNDVSLCQPRI